MPIFIDVFLPEELVSDGTELALDACKKYSTGSLNIVCGWGELARVLSVDNVHRERV